MKSLRAERNVLVCCQVSLSKGGWGHRSCADMLLNGAQTHILLKGASRHWSTDSLREHISLRENRFFDRQMSMPRDSQKRAPKYSHTTNRCLVVIRHDYAFERSRDVPHVACLQYHFNRVGQHSHLLFCLLSCEDRGIV